MLDISGISGPVCDIVAELSPVKSQAIPRIIRTAPGISVPMIIPIELIRPESLIPLKLANVDPQKMISTIAITYHLFCEYWGISGNIKTAAAKERIVGK